MSNHPTSKDSPSVISLPVSEDGAEHLSLQDGNQADLFGQDHPHVSRLAQQEVGRGNLTPNDISGLSSSISSASAALQQSLVSRLQAQLDLDGLTMYKGIWKQKTTPQQRLYYQVGLSTPRTKENGCSSWPTPSVRDYKDTGNLDKSRFRKSGKERHDTVPRVAFGTAPLPSTAETTSTVPPQLNHRFSLWLMGYPIEWAYSGEQVTLSSRKQPPKL